LKALLEEAKKLPPEQRQALDPFLNRMVESERRRREILTQIQDTIGQLRLDMKYLIFDLECTRRERDRYRQQWEEKGP